MSKVTILSGAQRMYLEIEDLNICNNKRGNLILAECNWILITEGETHKLTDILSHKLITLKEINNGALFQTSLILP